jgi:hypothetical protein
MRIAHHTTAPGSSGRRASPRLFNVGSPSPACVFVVDARILVPVVFAREAVEREAEPSLRTDRRAVAAAAGSRTKRCAPAARSSAANRIACSRARAIAPGRDLHCRMLGTSLPSDARAAWCEVARRTGTLWSRLEVVRLWLALTSVRARNIGQRCVGWAARISTRVQVGCCTPCRILHGFFHGGLQVKLFILTAG